MKDYKAQRRYQLAKRDRGICIICTRPRVNNTLCEIHVEKQRQYIRRHDAKRPSGWQRVTNLKRAAAREEADRNLPRCPRCNLLLPCNSCLPTSYQLASARPGAGRVYP